MQKAGDETPDVHMMGPQEGQDKQQRPPALQVICLGNGGGPCEDNVTGLMVRSIASEWARNSLLAVDAGSHLAPIVRILERDFPTVSSNEKDAGKQRQEQRGGPSTAQDVSMSLSQPQSSSVVAQDVMMKDPEPTTLQSGPFAGLRFPKISARANALHVIRNFVSTYLITHPHLDHLSGFAINTAAFHATSRPKTLAALPSTVDAVKQHIFNDIIWPNLTDEDGGVGFVTFQRLKEGGDVMVGEGEGRGYIDVSDRLGVKAFKVSHGKCTKTPTNHQHRASIHALSDAAPLAHSGGGGAGGGGGLLDSASGPHGTAPMTRSYSHQFPSPGTPGPGATSAARQSYVYSSSAHASPRLGGINNPASAAVGAGGTSGPALPPSSSDHACVVDSSAFFIREEESQREVLIFGDVEPDSLSLSPRNHFVWAEAASKITRGALAGVFIECSYDDSQADAVLFGHLNPRHLIAELLVLAGMVVEAREAVSAGGTAEMSGRGGSFGSSFGAGASARKRKRSGAVPFSSNGLLGLPDIAAAGASSSSSAAGGGEQEDARKRSRSVADRTIVGQEDTGTTGLPFGYRDSATSQSDGSLASRVAAGRQQRQSVSGSAAVGGPAASGSPPSESVSPKTRATRKASIAEVMHQPSAPASSSAPSQHQQQHGEGLQAEEEAEDESSQTPSQLQETATAPPPLQGIKIIIIHVKDTLQDGPHVSETILAQLRDYEEGLTEEGRGLGCEFVIAEAGESYWF